MLLLKKKLFEKLGGFRNLPLWADYDCWLGLQNFTDSLYIDKPLIYYDGSHAGGRKYENNIQVTYFFQSGRKNFDTESQAYAKEMFYGLHHFQKICRKVNIIEFSPHKSILGKFTFRFLEKNLQKLFKLPIYWSFITNKRNYKIIKKSNILIFSNNRMGCSGMPMVQIARYFHKFKSVCFIMGLFSREPKYKIFSILQSFYILWFIRLSDDLIFLGEGEYNKAKDRFPKYNKKFKLLPFAVDLDIWTPIENNTKEKKIIFYL